ncbi:MAG: hypothetical protein C7N36_12335 [Bacteroidetes bacterium]|nr:MAG: hypothetical protein C7N36_12335 [Bacteroidota bacterium]
MGKDSKNVKAFKASRLSPNEKVLFSLEGYIGKMMGSGDDTQHNGSFIITDKRVAFYKKGLFTEIYKGISISNISSLEQNSILSHRTIAIHTSGEDITFKTSESKQAFNQAYEIIEELRNNLTSAKNTQPANLVSNSSNEVFDKIKMLGDLMEKGLITNEEFQEQKKRLLDSI